MTLVATPAHGVEAQLSGVVHLHPSLEGDAVARRGVVLDVAAGEAVALLGATGTGKSTVLSLVGGRILRVCRAHPRGVSRVSERSCRTMLDGGSAAARFRHRPPSSAAGRRSVRHRLLLPAAASSRFRAPAMLSLFATVAPGCERQGTRTRDLLAANEIGLSAVRITFPAVTTEQNHLIRGERGPSSRARSCPLFAIDRNDVTSRIARSLDQRSPNTSV